MEGSRAASGVGVVGLGYVGLPLTVAFAGAGLDVVGVDRDPRKVESVSKIVLVPYSKAYEDPGYMLGWTPEHALDSILSRVISYVREQRVGAASPP